MTNGFALLKFDASSREMTASALLGEDPDDPTGPRGEFHGYGALGVGDDAVWVFDGASEKLHKIAKSDLEIEETVDFTSEIPEESDKPIIGLNVGAENVYVVNYDNGSDESDIFAVDKDSLDVSSLLTTDGSILSGVAVNQDLVLYELVGDGVTIVDGTTGDAVASYPLLALDDKPTIWVP